MLHIFVCSISNDKCFHDALFPKSPGIPGQCYPVPAYKLGNQISSRRNT